MAGALRGHPHVGNPLASPPFESGRLVVVPLLAVATPAPTRRWRWRWSTSRAKRARRPPASSAWTDDQVESSRSAAAAMSP